MVLLTASSSSESPGQAAAAGQVVHPRTQMPACACSDLTLRARFEVAFPLITGDFAVR